MPWIGADSTDGGRWACWGRSSAAVRRCWAPWPPCSSSAACAAPPGAPLGAGRAGARAASGPRRRRWPSAAGQTRRGGRASPRLSSWPTATSSSCRTWLELACAAALTAGTALGGWRIIRTVGRRIYRIRSIDGLARETGASGVILGASFLGAPVSTTQVVASSVVGLGGGRRRWHHIRWAIVRQMGLVARDAAGHRGACGDLSSSCGAACREEAQALVPPNDPDVLGLLGAARSPSRVWTPSGSGPRARGGRRGVRDAKRQGIPRQVGAPARGARGHYFSTPRIQFALSRGIDTNPQPRARRSERSPGHGMPAGRRDREDGRLLGEAVRQIDTAITGLSPRPTRLPRRPARRSGPSAGSSSPTRGDGRAARGRDMRERISRRSSTAAAPDRRAPGGRRRARHLRRGQGELSPPAPA